MLVCKSLGSLKSAIDGLPGKRSPGAGFSVLHVSIEAAAVLSDAHGRPASATAPGHDRWHEMQGQLALAVSECADSLQQKGIGCIAFVCVSPRHSVARAGFRRRQDAAECGPGTFCTDPMLSHIEPPTAALLEAQVLPAAVQYVPSHAHQLSSFLMQVRICLRGALEDNS